MVSLWIGHIFFKFHYNLEYSKFSYRIERLSEFIMFYPAGWKGNNIIPNTVAAHNRSIFCLVRGVTPCFSLYYY